MINTIIKDFELNKGADFTLKFKLYRNGEVEKFENQEIQFEAINTVGASPETVIYKTVSDSPGGISVDSDGLIVIRVPYDETEEIQFDRLLFRIDTANADGGYDRRVVGNIQCNENI